MIPTLYDVLIIGAGPAGLATATALSRQLYTTVLFDSGLYRNARAANMHNVLGFDHVAPSAFRAKARADLAARYSATATFADVAVTKTTKLSNGLFAATDASGSTWLGRRIVLAVGVTDLMPPGLDGYADCWGRGIFHCLFCHGFEERGASSAGVLAIGLLGEPKWAAHIAYMARPLAGRVTVYTDGNEALASEITSAAESAGSPSPWVVESRKIVRMRMGAGTEVILTLADGEHVTEGFLSHAPFTKVNGPFAEQLGLEMEENGDIKTTQPFGETSLPGVYAVGDCGNKMKAVATAAAGGALCAGGMVVPMQMEPRVTLNSEAVEKALEGI